jgi:ribose transport system substrate-binding protein
MRARGRTSIKLGGCDAMSLALQAVTDGRMVATVRNPSCLIHGGAIIAGVADIVSSEKTGTGPRTILKHIVMDGPVVTKANAPGPSMDGRALPDLSDVPMAWPALSSSGSRVPGSSK